MHPSSFRCMPTVSPIPGWGWEMGREGAQTRDRTASGGGPLTACRKGDWPPCWGSKARGSLEECEGFCPGGRVPSQAPPGVLWTGGELWTLEVTQG